MSWEDVFYNNLPTYISIINSELQKEYPLEPLSNHIKILGGYAFKANEYKSSGVPVIRISDFNDEQIDLSNVKFYKEDKIFDKFQLFSGDIIIAMTGGTIGKLAIVQDGLGKLYLNQRVGKFQILNKAEFEPEYVYWLARGIQDKVKNLGYGGAQPNVSNAQIESLQFPFPDRKIQIKIIKFLKDLKENSLEQKVYFNQRVENEISRVHAIGANLFILLEEIEQQRSYLKLLSQTILQEAVQGKLTKQDANDEPATELLKRIKAEKDKLIKEGRVKKEKELPPIADDEILFDLPKGWVWCRIAEVATVKVGSTPNRNEVEYWRGKIPWVSSGEVSNNYITRTKEKITERALKETSVFLYPVNTVLIAMIGQGKTRGQTSILGIPATTNQNVAGCMIDHRLIVPEYLWLYFMSAYENNRNNARGGNQPALNGQIIKHLPFPVPPLLEQQRIVAKVRQLQKQLGALETQVQRSRQYAQQLLQAVLKEAFEVNKKQYASTEQLTMAAEE